MNRDFKGVWIPKEIWLSSELKMLEKVILTEINSLDNENHCIAGNEYLAEFCSCSLSAVSKAIKHLKELGYIEELEFDGRHRKLRVVNFTKQSSKIYDAESENLLSNNISNNTNSKINNNSKELLLQKNPEFEFGKQKPKKETLYTKCLAMIDDFISKHNAGRVVRERLIEYLNFRLSVKDKPLYTNMWKGMLNKLDELHKLGYGYEPIINYCLERGYLSFYPPAGMYGGNIKSESGSRHVPRMTEEDYKREAEHLAELEARGERVRF